MAEFEDARVDEGARGPGNKAPSGWGDDDLDDEVDAVGEKGSKSDTSMVVATMVACLVVGAREAGGWLRAR